MSEVEYEREDDFFAEKSEWSLKLRADDGSIIASGGPFSLMWQAQADYER